jgi:beta-glucanase (GH16 family)
MAYKSISMKNIIIIVILFTNILVANAQDPNCYYPLPWEFFPHRSTTSKGLLWEYEWISAGEHVDCSEYDGWVLADYDNFEGIKLDPTKWTIAPWYFTTQNWPNEVACYLKGDNNVKVNGGFVDLIIKKEDHSERIKPELDYGVIIKDEDGWPLANDHTFNYTSGFIGTRQRMPAGKVETYLKIPENDRTWPAFWSRLDNWPGCSQEIDGFEFYMKEGCDGSSSSCPRSNYSNQMHMNFYRTPTCGGTIDGNSGYGDRHRCSTDFTSGFFKFSYEWDPLHIIYRINDYEIKRVYKWINLGGLAGQVDPCVGPDVAGYRHNILLMPEYTNMNVLFNVAMGNWCPECLRLNDGPLPDKMSIDWYKYWVKINCNEVKDICTFDYTMTKADGMESPSVITGGILNIAGPGCSVILGNNVNHGTASDPIWDYKNQYLTLIASNEINLNPGFEALPGSYLDARGEVCPPKKPIEGKNEKTNEEILNESMFAYRDEDGQISNEYQNEFKVYPNPVNDILTIGSKIDKSNYYDVYFTDINGKILEQIIGGNINEGISYINFNVSKYSNGTYFIIFRSNTNNDIVKRVSIIR